MDKIQYIWQSPDGNKGKIIITTGSDDALIDGWFKRLEDNGWILVSSKRISYRMSYLKNTFHDYWFWAFLFISLWFTVIQHFRWNNS